MSLRALAFGDLAPGQAKAGQSVRLEGQPEVGGQPSNLPGEAADTTGLPTLGSLSPTSLGLLAQGAQATSGGVPLGASDAPGSASGAPSGDVPTGTSDTPVAGPISTLPGFQEPTPDATATAGQDTSSSVPATPFNPTPSAQQAATGQGVSDQTPSPIPQQVSGLVKMASNQLGKATSASVSDQTRGDTGGASLSDQARSGPLAAMGGVDAIPAFTPPPVTFAPGNFDLSNIPGAPSPGDPSSIESFSGFGSGGISAPEIAPDVAGDLSSAGTSALGGALMAGISAIPSIWEGLNDYFQSQQTAKAKLGETKGIRNDFSTAWPSFAKSGQTLQDIAGTSDPDALRKLLSDASYEVEQQGPVSQFISTQGGRQTAGSGLNVPATDVSSLESVSPDLARRGLLAWILGQDKLSNAGVTDNAGVNNIWGNPWNTLDSLSNWAGGADLRTTGPMSQTTEPGIPGATPDRVTDTPTPYQLTPEETASFNAPGGGLAAVQKFFSQHSPNFGGSPLEMDLQRLGIGQPVAAAPDASAPAPVASPSLTSMGGLSVDPTAAALALQKKKDEDNAVLQGAS